MPSYDKNDINRRMHGALFVTNQIMLETVGMPYQFVINVKHRATRVAEYVFDTFAPQCFYEYSCSTHLHEYFPRKILMVVKN